MDELTIEALLESARKFAEVESTYPEPSLYGVTDGKAVGTYVEHKFKAFLSQQFDYKPGNSASGIDLPELNIDIKVTSIAQPQSSSPYRSARQKIFGLGYSLLVFVYSKTDDPVTRTATLNIVHTLFIASERTADYVTTRGLLRTLENGGNMEDIIGFLGDRNLPVDEIEARSIAQDLLSGAPLNQGYLTISNALQWRLQYTWAIPNAGSIDGIVKVR